MALFVPYASQKGGPMAPGMAELAPHNARNAGTTGTTQNTIRGLQHLNVINAYLDALPTTNVSSLWEHTKRGV